jgi:hypothetical protein
VKTVGRDYRRAIVVFIFGSRGRSPHQIVPEIRGLNSCQLKIMIISLVVSVDFDFQNVEPPHMGYF